METKYEGTKDKLMKLRWLDENKEFDWILNYMDHQDIAYYVDYSNGVINRAEPLQELYQIKANIITDSNSWENEYMNVFYKKRN